MRAFRRRAERVPASRRPPKQIVDQGACPFERCRYGAWKVLKDTELYDRPRGTTVVARVAAGQEVQARTGDVYVKPVLAGVGYAHEDFVVGEVFWLLYDVGEGTIQAWRESGARQYVFIDGREDCVPPDAYCWFEVLDPGSKAPAAWWVEIAAPTGRTGWTEETAHFSGQDACE